MKRIGVLLSLLAVVGLVYAQSAVIRGESSPGVYENLKSDGSQHLITVPNGPVQLTVTTTSPSVLSATAILMLAANSARKFLVVQNNDSSNSIFLNFGASATTNTLKIATGASLFMDTAVTQQFVTAIASPSINNNVVVLEGQ